MQDELASIDADNGFFNALIAADINHLDQSIADDFVLVGVFDGAEIAKGALIDVIQSGMLNFVSIEPTERRVRRYGDTAIVNGRTSMTCRFEGNEVSVRSRYTHVFVLTAEQWLLVSAQGTPIADATEE